MNAIICFFCVSQPSPQPLPHISPPVPINRSLTSSPGTESDSDFVKIQTPNNKRNTIREGIRAMPFTPVTSVPSHKREDTPNIGKKQTVDGG